MALGNSSTMLPIAAAILSVIYFLGVAFRIGRRTKSMPIGPPTLPLIGNIHQLPTAHAHLQFTAWARIYGGLYTLKVASGTIAVITDRRIIKTVIEKKSSIYSERPPSYLAQDVISQGEHVPTVPYGNKWRVFRRLLHQHFMESMCETRHLELQDAEAIQLVNDFLDKPGLNMANPRRYSNSVANSIAYGIRAVNSDSPDMKRLYDLMEHFSSILEPGATPRVDIIPLLKYLPQRLFSNWFTRAQNIDNEINSLASDLLAKVTTRRLKGKNLGSFMDEVLDHQDETRLDARQLRSLGAVVNQGGSDTTASAILAILQAMFLYPDVQRKAQAQIDSVVGASRSPVWADFKRLPYINQIMKKGQRWRPVAPIALPHALSQDDWIEGKFLPKGTTVILNSWGIQMDDTVWKEPEHFVPERYDAYGLLANHYIATETRDHYDYGYGRRVCPGIHLAERTIWLAMAKLLWALKFEHATDGDGDVIALDTDPVTGYHTGVLTCPKDYTIRATVRSDEIKKTMRMELEDAQNTVFSRFGVGWMNMNWFLALLRFQVPSCASA